MSEQVTRIEDMSPDGRLVLLQQRDGDVVVIIHPASGTEESRRLPFGASVEFCVSGGRSPNTLHALRDLMVAIEKDNAERPILEKEAFSIPSIESLNASK